MLSLLACARKPVGLSGTKGAGAVVADRPLDGKGNKGVFRLPVLDWPPMAEIVAFLCAGVGWVRLKQEPGRLPFRA